MARAIVITESLISNLRAKGAKPANGRGKLGFPASAPAAWAKLPDGTVLRAEEHGEQLVAV